MSVLVIGGCGYIGTRLVKYLNSKEIKCTSLDMHLYGCCDGISSICKNYNQLTKQELSQFDKIILLAGCSSVGMSGNYRRTFEENVINFFNLIKNLSKDQLLIYASSSSVYGVRLDAKETNELVTPFNNYDFTKQTIDYISKFSNKNVVGLRFGTVCGFSPNFRTDLIINAMTLNAINDGKITISNQDSYRTILDIADLCRGIYYLITSSNNIKSKIYNMGSCSSKIGDIGKKIKQLTNCEIIYNNKFNSNYSFTIDSELFENTFNFKFTGNIETIFKDIQDNLSNIEIFNKRVLHEA